MNNITTVNLEAQGKGGEIRPFGKENSKVVKVTQVASVAFTVIAATLTAAAILSVAGLITAGSAFIIPAALTATVVALALLSIRHHQMSHKINQLEKEVYSQQKQESASNYFNDESEVSDFLSREESPGVSPSPSLSDDSGDESGDPEPVENTFLGAPAPPPPPLPPTYSKQERLEKKRQEIEKARAKIKQLESEIINLKTELAAASKSYEEIDTKSALNIKNLKRKVLEGEEKLTQFRGIIKDLEKGAKDKRSVSIKLDSNERNIAKESLLEVLGACRKQVSLGESEITKLESELRGYGNYDQVENKYDVLTSEVNNLKQKIKEKESLLKETKRMVKSKERDDSEKAPKKKAPGGQFNPSEAVTKNLKTIINLINANGF